MPTTICYLATFQRCCFKQRRPIQRIAASIIIGCGFIYLSDAINAATFVVDAQRGSDDGGDGTLVNPWQSLSVAAERMAPTDECLVRRSLS